MINWRYPFEYSPYRPFEQTMRLDKYLLMNRPDLDFTDDTEMLDAMYDLCFTGTAIELIDSKYRDAFVLLFAHEFLMRQLGLETVNLWKDRLNHQVRKEARHINALFDLASDPQMYSLKYVRDRDEGRVKASTEQKDRNSAMASSIEGEDSAVSAGSTNSNGKDLTKNSDTPQGSIADLEDGKYLTNVTIGESDNNADTSGASSSNSKSQTSSTGVDSENASAAENEATNEKETMLQLDYEKLIAYAKHNFVDDILDLFRDLFILFE